MFLIPLSISICSQVVQLICSLNSIYFSTEKMLGIPAAMCLISMWNFSKQCLSKNNKIPKLNQACHAFAILAAIACAIVPFLINLHHTPQQITEINFSTTMSGIAFTFASISIDYLQKKKGQNYTNPFTINIRK